MNPDKPINSVLLTGGTGFLGQTVCRLLLERGYQLRLLVHRRPLQRWQQDDERIDVVEGDLSRPESLQTAAQGMDAIVHLAGLAHVNNADAGAMERVNVQGTVNLLQAAREAVVAKFIYLSSSLAAEAEAGGASAGPYGRSKLAAETEVLAAGRKGQLGCVILRPVNIYGVGMAGNIATMIRLISRGVLPRLPLLSTALSLVGDRDVARAVLLVLEQEGVDGQIYTLTDEERYSINAIEEAVYQALGRKIPALRLPRVLLYGAAAAAGLLNSLRGKRGGIGLRTYRNLVTDNLHSDEKIRQELGFFPSSTFYQELPGIIAAQQQHKT